MDGNEVMVGRGDYRRGNAAAPAPISAFVLGVEEVVADGARDDGLPMFLHEHVAETKIEPNWSGQVRSGRDCCCLTHPDELITKRL